MELTAWQPHGLRVGRGSIPKHNSWAFTGSRVNRCLLGSQKKCFPHYLLPHVTGTVRHYCMVYSGNPEKAYPCFGIRYKIPLGVKLPVIVSHSSWEMLSKAVLLTAMWFRLFFMVMLLSLTNSFVSLSACEPLEGWGLPSQLCDVSINTWFCSVIHWLQASVSSQVWYSQKHLSFCWLQNRNYNYFWQVWNHHNSCSVETHFEQHPADWKDVYNPSTEQLLIQQLHFKWKQNFK